MKFLIKLVNVFRLLLIDENGLISSKRFVGLMASFTLCSTMFIALFLTKDICPSDSLINAVALLAFGALGLSSVDKFTIMKDKATSKN
jgi:hypothetical protein